MHMRGGMSVSTAFLGIAAAGFLGTIAFAQPTADMDAQSIIVDGSSTVAPVTQAVAAEFSKVNSDVQVSVSVSGTSGGFRRFLPKETDINDASRPIKSSEIKKAKENGVEFIEALVGFDGLTVAVDRETHIFNGGPACMTVGELELLWSREADGTVTNWKHLGSRFADAKVVLSGAAETSGTFDFFTETVTGKDGDTRGDYFATEEDQLLAERTSQTPGELTYFGYAFYVNNQDIVQAVAVDPSRQLVDAPADVLKRVNAAREKHGKEPLKNGAGSCKGVRPNVDSIGSFDYSLTRPLFIYVNKQSAQRKAVDDFIDFYLDEKRIGSEAFMLDVGYIPEGRRLREAARACFNGRVKGSAFGGAIAGLSAREIVQKYSAHCGL